MDITPPLPSLHASPVGLSLGGLDPSAGAGILRDAMTMASLGVHPMAVPLSETLQNGVGCFQIAAPSLSPRLRLEALRPHLMGIWGVKLGLADCSPSELGDLAADLREAGPTAAIWDPILAPTSGVGLHGPAELRRMADALLPVLSWVVAPNRLEAAALAETRADDAPEVLAEPFLARGARAVWLKGGHAEGGLVEDFWITPEGARSLGTSPRLPGDRRGTGCTLASAWLAYRLRGLDDEPAARAAAQWLRDRWEGAFAPGGVGRPLFAPEGGTC